MIGPDDNDDTSETQEDQDDLAAEWAAMAEDDEKPEQKQDAVAAEPAATAKDDEKPQQSDDDVAAEWAAMAEEDSADGGDGSQPGAAAQPVVEAGAGVIGDVVAGAASAPMGASSQPARELNQDEIDNLLGFGDDKDGASKTAGINAILDSALVSYERLPMLEVVFDRLVRLMTTSLRNFTSDNVEVSLDGLNSVRFGDFLNSIPLPALLTVFRAEEWDDFGLITIDSALIYSVVDALLGGGRDTAPIRVEGRPYTTIERNLVERMIQVVLSDLTSAFSPLTPVTFSFDRLETNPRFAAIARQNNAAITARMRVDMDDRGGYLELLIPYATLEPIRELLLQMFYGEKFGRDSIWEGHLANELWQMQVEIDAVLDEQYLPFREVANLRVGDTLPLQAGTKSPIILSCGGIDMAKGSMGRAGDKVAVRIDETLMAQGKAS